MNEELDEGADSSHGLENVGPVNNLVKPNRRTKLILGYMVSTVALFCALLALYEGFTRFAVLSIVVALSVALVTYLYSRKHKKINNR